MAKINAIINEMGGVSAILAYLLFKGEHRIDLLNFGGLGYSRITFGLKTPINWR